MKAATSSTSQTVSAVLAVAVVIVATGVTWMLMRQQRELDTDLSNIALQPVETPIPSPSPTPTKLFHGKETYSVSRGTDATGPNISSVTLDPLDPDEQESQTISVKASNADPITAVSLSIRTDYQTTTLTPVLTDGNATDGTWSAAWKIPESYLYNYIVTVKVTSGQQTTTIPVTIRQRP